MELNAKLKSTNVNSVNCDILSLGEAVSSAVGMASFVNVSLPRPKKKQTKKFYLIKLRL